MKWVGPNNLVHSGKRSLSADSLHMLRGLLIVILMLNWQVLCVPATADEVDFNRDIRPILSSRCFKCHGPDEGSREADLRLDTFEGATEWVIDLESPEDSELLRRIEANDPDEIMPPPAAGELSRRDRQLLRNWIESGAHYDRHWSHVRPSRPQVPSGSPWHTANEIDCFVYDNLRRQQLAPTAQASRRVLIRRLALDLTGLPPTLHEVECFEEDGSAEAYEKIVDGYLDQPSYGERWAAVWLDLARYADSAGFAEDRPRTIWAFRDYVIRAYNDNRPFDRFTLEQIAGDLLPDATDETRVATAFHRNTLTNSEGGTIDEEFRSAAVVDRVNTTMAVWMGTTMACAQCHTHKYDPISQTEYFQFYDFFNHTKDNDQPDESPVLSIYDDDAEEQRRQLRFAIEELKRQAVPKPTPAQTADWVAKVQKRGPDPIEGRYVRIELPGYSRILSLAEVQVFAGRGADQRNIAVDGTATQSSTASNGPPELANDGNTDGVHKNHSVSHTATENNPWWEVDLGTEQPVDRIVIWNRTDADLYKRMDGYRILVLDAERNIAWSSNALRAKREAQETAVEYLPSDLLAKLGDGDALRDVESHQVREIYHRALRFEHEHQILQLQRQHDAVPTKTTVPVMAQLAEDRRRKTHLQIRGSYMNTGAQVSAGTPAAFHPLPEEGQRDRLMLARWLIDEDNPLTARVVVNRYWEQLFGIGLVRTSEEFGTQGEPPALPELLDWLAVDLMEHGWDTKRLVKQLVMSNTYRQSSVVTPELLERDPDNRWLARGPRFRLPAEMVRDQALAVSGLLSSRMYGPPVHPPQPKVGLKPAFTAKTTDWEDATNEDRYRRGIYTEWRRSAPYPSMSTFDISGREVCEIRRINTNTPLQALVTLNDPVYVEAAKALARRITAEAEGQSVAEKMRLAFTSCLIRQPQRHELATLVSLFEEAIDHFARNETAAEELAIDPLNPPAKDTDLVELAAWTTVSNVLLNLDEMLMKP